MYEEKTLFFALRKHAREENECFGHLSGILKLFASCCCYDCCLRSASIALGQNTKEWRWWKPNASWDTCVWGYFSQGPLAWTWDYQRLILSKRRCSLFSAHWCVKRGNRILFHSRALHIILGGIFLPISTCLSLVLLTLCLRIFKSFGKLGM